MSNLQKLKNPVKNSWDLGDNLDLVDNKELMFMKDLSQSEMKQSGNLLLVHYKKNYFKILKFSSKGKIEANFDFYTNKNYYFVSVRFYKGKIYGLAESQLVEISFINGYGKAPDYKFYKFKEHKYKDFFVNNAGIFIFLVKKNKSICHLTAAPTPDAEGKEKRHYTLDLFEASFVYTSFSHFILKKKDVQNGPFKSFYFNPDEKRLQEAMYYYAGPAIDTSYPRLEFFETKHLLYYVYFKGNYTEKMEVYGKMSKLPSSQLTQKIKGNFVGLVAGYEASMSENAILVASTDNSKSTVLKKYQAIFSESSLTCSPEKAVKDGEAIESYKLKTGKGQYSFLFCFGKKCKLKSYRGNKEIIVKKLRNVEKWMFIGGLIFFGFVLILCRWCFGGNANIKEAEEIIQGIEMDHKKSELTDVSGLESDISLSDLNRMSMEEESSMEVDIDEVKGS